MATRWKPAVFRHWAVLPPGGRWGRSGAGRALAPVSSRQGRAGFSPAARQSKIRPPAPGVKNHRAPGLARPGPGPATVWPVIANQTAICTHSTIRRNETVEPKSLLGPGPRELDAVRIQAPCPLHLRIGRVRLPENGIGRRDALFDLDFMRVWNGWTPKGRRHPGMGHAAESAGARPGGEPTGGLHRHGFLPCCAAPCRGKIHRHHAQGGRGQFALQDIMP